MNGVSNREILTVAEPEAFTDAIRGSHLDACVLSSRPGVSRIERHPLPRVCLDRAALSSPMWFSGQMAEGCYTMIYVVSCPTEGHSLNFGKRHGPGYMGFFAPGGLLDALTPAGYSNATLTIPAGLFLDIRDRCYPEISGNWLACGQGLRISEPAQARMSRFFNQVADLDRIDPGWSHIQAAREAFERDLLELFFGALSESTPIKSSWGSGRIARRYSALRQMRGHVMDHPQAILRLDQLCGASGMSRRGLEYTCKDLLGVGVNTFVRLQRLHGARRALVRSDPQSGAIKRIALEWGYWHFGRFAQEYRELFGETPSETLAAGRRI